MSVEQGAVPAGLAKRTPGARATTGLRPEALGPPARSLLTVRASRESGPAAESAARAPKRHRDGAPRGAGVPSQGMPRTPQGANIKRAPRGAPSPRRLPREGRGRQAAPGLKEQGRYRAPGPPNPRLPFSALAAINHPEPGPRHPWRLAVVHGRPTSAAFFH